MKFKDIKKLNKDERTKKMKELKVELIKSKVAASKTGNTKTREIKKIIARILTLNKSEKDGLKNK